MSITKYAKIHEKKHRELNTEWQLHFCSECFEQRQRSNEMLKPVFSNFKKRCCLVLNADGGHIGMNYISNLFLTQFACVLVTEPITGLTLR